MVSTTEQMESMLPSTDTDYYNTPEQDFTASDFASDTWEQARKRFMDAGITNTDPNDPKLITAYNRSMDYLKDVGLSGLLATQAAYEFAVGSIADSVPFASEDNKKRLAKDLAAMPEAFVGGGTKSLSQLDDIAELAAPAAKQTIAKTVDLADRVYIDPTKTGAIAGSFSLRTPLETGNFKRARELFKKFDGSDPRNFNSTNTKVFNETGWYINPSDNQWRFEINDKPAKINFKNFQGKELLNQRQITGSELFDEIQTLADNKSIDVSLTDFFKHEKLYKRYPHLKRMRVTFSADSGANASLGSFTSGQNLITINPAKVDLKDKRFKEILMHEIQHSIQEYEGFIPGASSSRIPFEVTEKHAKTLTSELVNARITRQELLNELDDVSLGEGYNTGPFFKLLSRDENLKPGVTLFASEESVVDKFAQAAKESGLPDNIFDLYPKEKGGAGGSPELIQLGNILNLLRGSHLDDVYHREAIENINEQLYRGTFGELEANVVGKSANMTPTERGLDPVNMQKVIATNQKVPEDFVGSYDATAGRAVSGKQPGFQRRKRSRIPKLGVVDAKIDINFDGVYNAFDVTNKDGKVMSAVQRAAAYSKFLLDSIIKNNKELKKIKNLKRGDTFSYTLDNGDVVQARFQKALMAKYDRQNVEKGEGQIILKDTDPSTYEDGTSFKVPEIVIELVGDGSIPAKTQLTISMPELIKNSDLVKDGKNFDIMDLQEKLPSVQEEGAVNKIKNLFGFSKADKKIQPTNLTDTIKNKFQKSDNVEPTKATLEDYGYYQDNPATKGREGGEDWVKKQQRYAEEDAARGGSGATKKFFNGPITANLGGMDNNKALFLDSKFLASLKGANDEVRNVSDSKYQGLLKDAQDNSFDPNQKGNRVVVGVNHKGEAYIIEGNTRAAVASELGIPSVKVEVRYWNGAETVDGPYSPQNILKYASKEPKNFAEGGDTVRPETRPEAEMDISPRAEAGDQFFVEQAERKRAFETKPMPRPSMDKSFPDVKPKPRPEEQGGLITRGFEIDGEEITVPIIKFKDGEEIALEAAIQKIRTRGTANEPTVGKATERQILNFIKQNNPTREEFETYWYNKRLNKGGMIDDQMQMAFMNEGGLTDDGMDVDPVSGNDIPSGSMAEEVRDDIPAQLSDGEYVVPADVVRYYGVKFFEDLRERAKMGLQDMEMNGRIGGEPVPDGGPINTQELSPQEMQALQEVMGMYGGGQVRGYQAAGSVTGNQVEQQMLSAGSAAQAENYVGSPLGFSIFGDSSTGVQNPNQQPETPTFTPITLYNTAGQTRTVNSEAEEKSARAADFTMTLEQYNLYRSQRGGSGGTGGGSGIITPPGEGEDQEVKPWGQDLKDWNDVDDIKQFVAQAERGNLSGSGRFLRGAGFAIAGLPGAMLAGAFQSFKGLKSIHDIEAAQIIAEAKGKAGSKEHADLAVKLKTDITTYLEKAGEVANFFYEPRSKNVMDKVNGVFAGTGYEDVDSWAAGTRKAGITKGTTGAFDPFKTSATQIEKQVKAAKEKRKKNKVSEAEKARLRRDASSGTGAFADRSGTSAKDRVSNYQKPKGEIGSQMYRGQGGRAEGGLMTKGKKK